jgi:hypothetical protein
LGTIGISSAYPPSWEDDLSVYTQLLWNEPEVEGKLEVDHGADLTAPVGYIYADGRRFF